MLRRSLLSLFAVVLATMAVATAASPASASCDTRFAVANESGTTVRNLFWSSSSNPVWGADRLGHPLAPGAVQNFIAGNAGNYDFKVILVDGRNATLRGVNVCLVTRITVTESGMASQ